MDFSSFLQVVFVCRLGVFFWCLCFKLIRFLTFFCLKFYDPKLPYLIISEITRGFTHDGGMLSFVAEG